MQWFPKEASLASENNFRAQHQKRQERAAGAEPSFSPKPSQDTGKVRRVNERRWTLQKLDIQQQTDTYDTIVTG